MKKLALSFILLSFVFVANGQVPLSLGQYSQNFDYPTLSYQSSQGTNWVNGVTIPWWYAETSFGAITNYRVSTGGVNNGALYSYGNSPNTDRALGSLGSGSYNNIAYGIRMVNDTALPIGSFTISYNGEQWRNGAPTTPATHTLAFSYQISGTPITSPDWANAGSWTLVPALDFNGPVNGGTAGALDGNLPANRVALNATFNLSLLPGREIFLRWYDINDVSNDHGLAVDDLEIRFAVPEPGTGVLMGLSLLLLARRMRK